MKIKVSDNNKLPEIINKCKKLDGKEIWVGIEGTEMQMIASVQEYGCTINVTPKMRAWLHRNGLHIKKTTTRIVIPERSFIRAGYDQNEKSFMQYVEDQISRALLQGQNVDTVLTVCADELAGIIQEYAIDLKNPKNHPFTVMKKKSSNPLVDTGKLIGSIKGKVK